MAIEAITQATHVGETVIQIFSEIDLDPDVHVAKENGQQQFFVFFRWYHTPLSSFFSYKGNTNWLSKTYAACNITWFPV